MAIVRFALIVPRIIIIVGIQKTDSVRYLNLNGYFSSYSRVFSLVFLCALHTGRKRIRPFLFIRNANVSIIRYM